MQNEIWNCVLLRITRMEKETSDTLKRAGRVMKLPEFNSGLTEDMNPFAGVSTELRRANRLLHSELMKKDTVAIAVAIDRSVLYRARSLPW